MAASADGGNFQFSKLYNNHTLAPVTGAHVGVARNSTGDTFFFHATSMIPAAPAKVVKADVYVFNNPAACSGKFATTGFPGRCGGPNGADSFVYDFTIVEGAPVGIAPTCRAGDTCKPLCDVITFDTCTKVGAGFQAFSGLPAGTPDAAGVDNYYVRVAAANPTGAELQIYLKTLNQPYVNTSGQTKTPKAFAFFAAPTDTDTDHPDGHGNPEARDSND